MTYSCTCPLIPISLHTGVENNSTEDLDTDTNEHTTPRWKLPLWEKTDRLTTVPWYIYIQFVEMKSGNTLKWTRESLSRAMFLGSPRSKGQSTHLLASFRWISYGEDNSEPMALKMVRYACASTCWDSGLPSSSGIMNRKLNLYPPSVEQMRTHLPLRVRQKYRVSIKSFPWIQTFITRKLRGIYIYIFAIT